LLFVPFHLELNSSQLSLIHSLRYQLLNVFGMWHQKIWRMKSSLNYDVTATSSVKFAYSSFTRRDYPRPISL